MNPHPTLHKALLAGVARVPVLDAGASEALNALLHNSTHPSLLWQALAANDLWQRAGFQPQNLANAAVPAAADERACPDSASHLLHLILRDIQADLLDSWLWLAQTSGCNLPHAFLVTLLDMGMQKPALRLALIPLLDSRGQWLVAQNPAWAERYGVVAEAPLETQWQLGNLNERCTALHALRDLDSEAALTTLEADWAREPPESRAAFVHCLGQALSLRDEAFLERALDDKRKEVRSAAQQLLARLPDSQLMQRCVSRLNTLLSVEHERGMASLLGALVGRAGSVVHLNLPEQCDSGMKRDGIGIQAHPGLGEKAGWLADLIGSVSPDHWTEIWQLAPSRIVGLYAGHEFNNALLEGLAQAVSNALRYQVGGNAMEWYRALLDDKLPGSGKYRAKLLPDLHQLPAPRQEVMVREWLTGTDPATLELVSAWCKQRPNAQPLPPELSHLLLARCQDAMLREDINHWNTRSLFEVLAKSLDVTDLAYVEQNWPDADWVPWPQWRETIDNFQETLRFRHTMQRSFMEHIA
jgi:hypothetical protein